MDQYREQVRKRHVPLTKLDETGEFSDKPKKHLYEDLQTATVWIPMQEISMMQLYQTYENEIPPEYRELAEAQAKKAAMHKQSDITPAFTTLDDKPDAPAFLPLFESEIQCARYLKRQFDKNPEIEYFIDMIKATDIIMELQDSPEEIIIGYRGTWIPKRDFHKALPPSLAEIPDDADGPPEDSDESISDDHTDELLELITACRSLLKCFRWSTRYGFLSSNEVAGEELITVSIEVATLKNTSPDSPALLPRKRPKLNKTRQKKVKHIIKYLKKKKIRFRLGMRRSSLPMQRDEDYDPLVSYEDIAASINNLPQIEQFKRKYFFSVKEVEGTNGILSDTQPFYDNTLPYNDVPRAFVTAPAERSLRREEKDKIPDDKKDKLIQDHMNTLSTLRSKDRIDDAGTTLNEFELDLLTKNEAKSVIFGPPPDRHSHSDQVYNLSEKEYALITRGPAAADMLGPPGYTFKKSGFLEDLGQHESYVFGVPTETSLQIDTIKTRRLKRDRDFRMNAAMRSKQEHDIQSGRWK
eukprot:TRINITY_DN33703_c0_g1_i1.p1 TRINITY_DN33703_c0_g1~~TRINITY_DN33703_c0_g1_i1.p1  ORF type:complete len:613 (+),score=110.76 TRINITY_DN33703_c0_g1_i1:266-1840(+)